MLIRGRCAEKTKVETEADVRKWKRLQKGRERTKKDQLLRKTGKGRGNQSVTNAVEKERERKET